jgi:hypothetical protein
MNSTPNNLAQYWFSADSRGTAESPSIRSDRDAVTPTQQQELDALAERVSAARSIF